MLHLRIRWTVLLIAGCVILGGVASVPAQTVDTQPGYLTLDRDVAHHELGVDLSFHTIDYHRGNWNGRIDRIDLHGSYHLPGPRITISGRVPAALNFTDHGIGNDLGNLRVSARHWLQTGPGTWSAAVFLGLPTGMESGYILKDTTYRRLTDWPLLLTNCASVGVSTSYSMTWDWFQVRTDVGAFGMLDTASGDSWDAGLETLTYTYFLSEEEPYDGDRADAYVYWNIAAASTWRGFGATVELSNIALATADVALSRRMIGSLAAGVS